MIQSCLFFRYFKQKAKEVKKKERDFEKEDENEGKDEILGMLLFYEKNSTALVINLRTTI